MFIAYFLRCRQGNKKQPGSLVNTTGRQLAERILQLQLIVVLICTLISFWVGWKHGLAASWGGLSACSSFVIFSRFAFYTTGARMSQLTVRAFYLGEALKIFTSLILLVVGLALLRLNAEPLLISFVLTQAPVWFGPILFKTKK